MVVEIVLVLMEPLLFMYCILYFKIQLLFEYRNALILDVMIWYVVAPKLKMIVFLRIWQKQHGSNMINICFGKRDK